MKRRGATCFPAEGMGKAGYFFFFDPDGNTLATALAIEPATFATTPFLELRLFALGFVFDFVRAFGAAFDFDFFFAAVFAITDTPTFSLFRIILNRGVQRSAFISSELSGCSHGPGAVFTRSS